MLFFLGIRRSTIATEHLSGLACAYCHTPETLTCTVFSRYVHLFWVPAFPVGKFSVTSCQHCKQVLTAREMPASYVAPVQAVQQQAKTPLTHFALLLLFGAVVLLSLLISVFGKKEPTAAAATAASAAPVPEAVGTRYKFDVADEGRQYGLIEVTGVTADSVQYRMTNALRGRLTTASAAVALRDSVAPGNVRQRASREQWNYSSKGQGLFKRFD
ncbi:hypothetical protein MON38_15175 [Hymenobacter sp. DH14]|uniref:Zinc-ribbon 15 domain-containing protein n=1 Tax=Hymenobacter cyanobacteriorum TaxID=2926463 RepID=A0A9X2AHF3_9BACT|nr:hypothetical protein [Hymenobacter cyanobacteriorum]MCI1188768.1 hypothetical protein [Hymenobacter cyanobacteriorum]